MANSVTQVKRALRTSRGVKLKSTPWQALLTPAQLKDPTFIRPSWTYRWHRRRTARGLIRSRMLKALRKDLKLSRQELDRRFHRMRLGKAAPPLPLRPQQEAA